MSSFSCPHFCEASEACLRLGTLCVPGRPGCVLPKTTVFATPWKERLEAKLQARAAQDADAAVGSIGMNLGPDGDTH